MRSSIVAFLAAIGALASCQSGSYAPYPRQLVPGTVRHYSCKKVPDHLVMDGDLNEAAWKRAPWSEAFMDIEGSQKPNPRYATWMKMLWDDSNLYIAAYIEDPDLWATMDKRDMVVFHENDFEVFIDPKYQFFKGPEANTQSYYEIEFNVIGTVFDLYMTKEYRYGGVAHPQWNCEGLDGQIRKFGTSNNASDKDRGWTFEMKIPFKSLRPPAAVKDDHTENIRDGETPMLNDQWRMNFSRVQWQLEKVGPNYVKKPGTREDNWSWSPQWAVDMHQLEHWGVVTFTK